MRIARFRHEDAIAYGILDEVINTRKSGPEKKKKSK